MTRDNPIPRQNLHRPDFGLPHKSYRLSEWAVVILLAILAFGLIVIRD